MLNQLETDLTAVYSGGDLIMIDHNEHAWLPACQQDIGRTDSQRSCLAQGGCRKMSALEFDHQVGNLGVVAASVSFLVGKKGICEW